MAAGAALGALFATGSAPQKSIFKKGEELDSALNDRIDARIRELWNKLPDEAGKPRGREDLLPAAKEEMVG